MNSKRVLVALSGGVDSSVAALLLQQQGYDVVGVFLRNGVEAAKTLDLDSACSMKSQAAPHKQGCCSAEDARDAALVADKLGIPFHALDMEAEFDTIQQYFRSEYELGRTPNPCAMCNRDIKFGALVQFADAMGAQYLATGHYARLKQTESGPQLLRGLDAHKDQSYVLFPVAESTLARTLLPIGELQKSETRALAEKAGFAVFGKPDSQEICFVPGNDYREVLRKSGGLGKAGRMVDLDGQVLAEHDGHMGFTRGQRRGLGFASTQPMYVIDIRADTGDVVVGPREATGSSLAEVEGFQAVGCELSPNGVLEGLEVQYRSAPGGVTATATMLAPDRLRIEFAEPAESVTPGQGLALYQGDRLLGGGWISWAQSAAVEHV
ncbi:MAG: tRNA 2-thiouridine(34) synthase MnmA [Planctomycetes bacterium]|nr:tRNA 2-thiouridine(34) synthase MnmA [Planctomycetota bacterium]